mmetsp:Transcript_88265/g.175403  ORF Transcript_88265/g.175403 Transcript_88265/m.175403 type:complete len:854 (-) Transcript_88265:123-2684(-)
MGKRKRHASNKDHSHADGGEVGVTESRGSQQEGQRSTTDTPAEGPPQQRRRRQQKQPQATQQQQEQQDQQTQQPHRQPQEQEQQRRDGCESVVGTAHDTNSSSSKERRNHDDIAPTIHQQNHKQSVDIAGGSRDANMSIHDRDNASNDLPLPLQNSIRARVSSKSFRGRSTTKGTRGVVVEGAAWGSARSEPDTWLQRVRQQVEFYFSDANLRQDAFLKKKITEGSGFVALSTIIQFNRIRSLRCRYISQLSQAIRKSDMLILNADKTKVKRDFDKHPEVSVDPLSRSVYIEGLPLTFGVDDLACFFAQYGHVRLVQLPRHRMTREPRGYCFVEYADARQAATAMAELDNTWPSGWPVRSDGRFLRLMPKRKWLACRDEYKQLCHAARCTPSVNNSSKGMTGQQRLTDPLTKRQRQDIRNTSNPAAPSVSTAALPQPIVESGSLASGRPPPAHGSSSSRAKPGCVIEVTNFPLPQTVTSIRQFAEHAVIVEYCDFNQPDGSVAHLRLRCPGDCQLLLEDLCKTGRMLGWVRPAVRVLGVEEEASYWRRVDERRAARGTADEQLRVTSSDLLAVPKKKRRSLLRPVLQNAHGAVSGGPGMTSSLSRWPFDGSASHRQKEATGKKTVRACSFVDTVGGNKGFVAAGFGRKRWLPRRGAGGKTRSASEDLLDISAPAAPTTAPVAALAAPPVDSAAATAETHPADEQDSAPPALGDAKHVGEGAAVPAIAIVPPSPMLQPSGAKAKRKPSRPNQPTPRSSLRSPPPTPVARPLGSMVVPPSPRRLEATRARREPSGKTAETTLPPPSPVAVPAVPAVPAVNSAAAEEEAGATGTTVDAGMDSMLEDTDDILDAMGL